MHVDRHSVSLLVEWSANPPADEQVLRRWLTTLVDRANEAARIEFAKAVETGTYPVNAITAKGAPQKPSEISLSIDRAPPAAILILNEVQDPDVLDPGNMVKGALKEELIRAFALWDVGALQTMMGPDGWRKGEPQPQPQPPPGDVSESPDDPEQPPDDQGQPMPEPVDTPEQDNSQKAPPETDDSAPERNWKPYLYALGGMTALGLGYWVIRRASK